MNKLLQIVGVGFGAILQIAAAQAEPRSIAWTAESEHALIVNDIVAIAPGAYCLAGADLDTGLAQTHAIIQKLDSSRGKPAWVTRASLTERGFFQNRFTSCTFMGGSIYGLEEVDTQADSNASQTLIFVTRFDKQGRLTARKQLILDGKKPWSVGMVALDEDLYVLLGEQKSSTKTAGGGMRLISLSKSLDIQRTITIPNGSFFYPSKMLATAHGIFLVGPFSKSAEEQDAELASAKLSLNGKYLWAQRFAYAASKSAFSVNPHTQEIRVSAVLNGELQSQTVNAAGRLSEVIKVKSTACRALGHSSTADSTQTIALDCDKPPQLINTDQTTGVTTPITKLNQKPIKSFDLPESTLIVIRSDSDTPEYRFLEIKK